eukprot:2532928-Rhodomonas_salina.1
MAESKGGAAMADGDAAASAMVNLNIDLLSISSVEKKPKVAAKTLSREVSKESIVVNAPELPEVDLRKVREGTRRIENGCDMLP